MPTYSTPPKVVSLPVAWNTANIATGVAVASLPNAGDLVTKVWLEVDTVWNSVTSDTVHVGIAKSDLSNQVDLATFDAHVASSKNANVDEASNAPASLGTTVGREAGAADVVFVKITSAGGSLSQGAGTVYALIESADAAGAAYVPNANEPTQTVSSGESAGYV